MSRAVQALVRWGEEGRDVVVHLHERPGERLRGRLEGADEHCNLLLAGVTRGGGAAPMARVWLRGDCVAAVSLVGCGPVLPLAR